MAYRLFNAKTIPNKEQPWYYLTNSCGDIGVHAFPKCITMEVKIIAWLELELTHYDVPV